MEQLWRDRTSGHIGGHIEWHATFLGNRDVKHQTCQKFNKASIAH